MIEVESPETLKRNVQTIAQALGFMECRIAPAAKAAHAQEYQDWVAQGKHGDMAWMERNIDRRSDVRAIVPEAKAVITLALNYYPGEHPTDTPPDYQIARYSWNDDYHDIIKAKLDEFNMALEVFGGKQRYYVDTGPVLERDYANEAGLGWSGKSCMQLSKDYGPWFFLCEMITTLPLTPDLPKRNYCGKCTSCLDHCPTGAIVAPHQVDARKCISYLTIENKGPIPEEFRTAMGNRIYGCDECLTSCPWNRFAKKSQEASFHARERIFQHSLTDFLAMTLEDFRETFAKSPIKRIKRDRFLRNVCVALGNVGSAQDLPALQKACAEENELVQEHAQWAIQQIQSRHAS